jgi:hypothetical protein
VAALYHDIGKIIQRDRHPTIGYYHLQYSPEAGRAAQHVPHRAGPLAVFCTSCVFTMCSAWSARVRGSLSALVDLIPMREMSEARAPWASSTCFLRINLADIAGTVPVREAKITHMMAATCAAQPLPCHPAAGAPCPTAGAGVSRSADRGRRQRGAGRWSRIQRMLAEPGLPEYQDPGLDIVIERALMASRAHTCGSLPTRFRTFASSSYLLRFVRALEQNAKEQGKPVRTVVNAFVALLCRVVNEYGDLTAPHGR